MAERIKPIPVAMIQRVRGCCEPVAAPIPSARAGELAVILKALGDPTRLQMIHILKSAKEPVCVCDFTAAFELGQPTVSHHLATLKDAGVVVSSKRGIWSFYALNPRMTEVAASVVNLVS